jgi:hypothetical protein
MISKSFSLFFSNPLKELYQGFISQLKFIFEFTIDTALLRNITNKTSDDVLQETFKVLKIIIFIIVANIAFNEIFRNVDSNLWNDLKSEGLYLVFFYISFLALYYISRIYERITNTSIHTTIVSRYQLVVMLLTMIFFQVSGIMNADLNADLNADMNSYFIKSELVKELAMENLAIIFLLFCLLVVIQSFYLVKRNLIRRVDVLFYLFMSALIFVFISINGMILLVINKIIVLA